jgi:protein gp37
MVNYQVMSKIEWTDVTWNPTTGCDKISPGCKYCYAEVMSRRLQAMGQEKYKDGFKLSLHEDSLLLPYSWKKPRMVFVNSMSDLFHGDVPVDFIQKVFRVMRQNPQHVFQVLTKRADRLSRLDEFGFLTWSNNIWMGVSVETPAYFERINKLRATGARTKFLSCEPLLEPLQKMDLSGIDWVIVGGESGSKPRLVQREWVLDIRDQCKEAHVRFFFKQWGGTNKKSSGRLLDGKIYSEMPKRR